MMEISNGVEFVERKGRGRCAIATKSHQPGSVVMETASIIPCVLKDELWDDRCWNCLDRVGTETVSRKKCSACSIARYCSKDCHKVHWGLVHRRECAHLKKITLRCPQHLWVNVLALARVLLLEVGGKVEEMENHLDDRCNFEDSKQIVEECEQFFPNLFIHLEQSKATELVMRFQYNNFFVVDELMNSIAAGIYPKGALLNHSCEPNCVLSYHTDKTTGKTFQRIVSVAEDVQPGFEFCHPYCDTIWSTARRRAHLEEMYKFTCTCGLCTGNNENDSGSEVSEPAKIAKESGELLTAALEEGNYTDAEHYCRQLLYVYRDVYHKYHPLIGLQYLTLADIQVQLDCDSEQAFANLEHARAIFKVTHGEKSKLFDILEQMKKNVAGV
uniref:Uncharacterized protein n=1 Tax=Mucochytrium quahogii TaxID=96639 RepID=A0A7S2SKR9_9STRA|mmetsp:Transcript_26821/g.43178  ORF Transcript_26821/g.43178 Transcript_26821/m.43178 type:complete len:386 (-) Transcript_26821:89-1246(-)|eukprot:CAMPEP_0203760608 /NCGR_PEP_ID=MMETSP0098-20131031/13869_1 /ASSEMBLY_ACC=CAM_ASM_000208 /TAXON_ID=96639 /ORGANISM=" , Strain NY0313808BC1" /LENGTH=385 /DNA_ID=CAMNT_0050654253 /DNA_START=217 /DNA_END=1374 /DNA_ORIENTATION=-